MKFNIGIVYHMFKTLNLNLVISEGETHWNIMNQILLALSISIVALIGIFYADLSIEYNNPNLQYKTTLSKSVVEAVEKMNYIWNLFFTKCHFNFLGYFSVYGYKKHYSVSQLFHSSC